MQSNANTHWNVCECGYKTAEAAHTGGNATCTDKAVCDVCGTAYGELAAHSFDKAVAEAKYLKSEATCSAKAVYYYSCVCGEKGTETFAFGEYADHDFSVAKYDETHHFFQCANCDATSEKVAHSFTETKHNAAQHWTVCSGCAAATAAEDHIGGKATCTENGICTVCQTAYLKATGHQNAEEVAEVAATCTTAGVKKHFHCADCGGDYLDKVATAKPQTSEDLKIAINPKNHPADKLSSVEAVAPGCHEGVGYKAYTYCLDCGIIMLADGTVVEASDLIVEPENVIVFVKKVNPTTSKDGMEAHYYCAGCGKYFSDAEGKVEVTRESLIIPATETPVTGDNTALFVLIALVILGGVGIAAILIYKKKARS